MRWSSVKSGAPLTRRSYLSGRPAPAPEGDAAQAGSLMVETVKLICDCYLTVEDAVHLNMIKALCSAVTQTEDVHEDALILCVRACFHVHRYSRVKVTQDSAIATLSQMLSVVFKRLDVRWAQTPHRTVSLQHTATATCCCALC
jgi:hypothetical protein